jgi:hypothetical protein
MQAKSKDDKNVPARQLKTRWEYADSERTNRANENWESKPWSEVFFDRINLIAGALQKVLSPEKSCYFS